MFYNSSVLLRDWSMIFCKINCFLQRWKGKILVFPTVRTCNSAFRWCCWTNEWLRWYFSIDCIYVWTTSFCWCFPKQFYLHCRFHILIGWLGDMIDLIKSCLYSLSVWHRKVSPQVFSIRSLNLIFIVMCFVSKLFDSCDFGGAYYHSQTITFLEWR